MAAKLSNRAPSRRFLPIRNTPTRERYCHRCRRTSPRRHGRRWGEASTRARTYRPVAAVYRGFSKNLTFETTIGDDIAGSRYVRRPGFDGALPQVRGSVDLCHLGAAPEISRNAADDVRLLPMQSHLELRAGAGHGRGLRRRYGTAAFA